MIGRRRAGRVASLGLICALLGCSRGVTTHAITDVRSVEVSMSAVAATSAERFGFTGTAGGDPHSMGGAAHSPDDGHDHGSAQPGLEWTTPPGWEEATASSMRRANFRVAGRDDTECYLTVLPGAAGGARANIDRWRGQMGLAPMDPSEFEALPSKALFGEQAVFVELEGAYQGMSGDSRPDYGLVGLIAERGGNTLFLKMVGPVDVVQEEREHFEQLAASFGVHAGTAPAPRSSSAPVGLRWSVPEGWNLGAARSMRLATFEPQGAPDTECYMTLLPGAAGGVEANVNRWRSQMGLAALSMAEIDALEKHDVLGIQASFIEIAGDFVGMAGEEVSGAGLLGMICEFGSRTLFIKMTGPADAVSSQREDFLSFCASLRFEEEAR